MTEPGETTSVPDAIRAAEELLDAMPPECVLTRGGHAGAIVRLPQDAPAAFNVIQGTAWVADLRDAAGFLVEVLGFRPRRPTASSTAPPFPTDLPRGFVVATVRGDWRLLRTSEAFELIDADGERREYAPAEAARLLGDAPADRPVVPVRARV